LTLRGLQRRNSPRKGRHAISNVDRPAGGWPPPDQRDGHSIETVVRPIRGWASLGLSDLAAYSDLLLFLVWRDVKVRYQQTVLGALWAIIQPLLIMAIFSVVFGRLIAVPSDGVPYPLFCFAGLVIWMLFIQGVTAASSSVVSNHELVQKVYFPRLIIPLAAILVGLVDFAVALLFLVGLMFIYGAVPTPRFLLIIPFILLAVAAATGVGAILAALNVRFRDVRHITPFLAQIWLLATPVAYPVSLVPDRWRALVGLNPMAGIVEGFRWALLDTSGAHFQLLATSTLVSIGLLLAGLSLFRHMEASFADVI
jgi:lipopolysaccharide transport system permease protein